MMPSNQPLRLILTGATGMVGEAVLHECLQSNAVEQILIINRRPAKVTHPKLTEIVHEDMSDLSAIKDQLIGYDGCLFCLGVSSVGMKEDAYTKVTYTLTMNIAKLLVEQNPGMTFCYISGASTDSTEKGRSMWARVKGKTENDLIKLPFKGVYNFRPGIMEPTKGLVNTLPLYIYLAWLIPVIKFFLPKSVISLKQLGDAMINVVAKGYDKHVLEISDIKALA